MNKKEIVMLILAIEIAGLTIAFMGTVSGQAPFGLILLGAAVMIIGILPMALVK